MDSEMSIRALNIILPLLLLVIVSFIAYLGTDNKKLVTNKLKCNDCSKCPHRDSCEECGNHADEDSEIQTIHTRNDIFRR